MIRKGMTLAEILITLGIVGIIAVLTLPAINDRIQAILLYNKFTKTYSLLSNAMQMMRLKDEFISYTRIDDYPKFGSNLRSYFNEKIYTCPMKATEPFCSADMHSYKNLSGDKSAGLGYTWYNAVNTRWVLPGGILIQVMAFGDKVFCVYCVYVDLNGGLAGPNRVGVDAFFFQLVGDELKPMGAKGTLYEGEEYCSFDDTAAGQNGHGCANKVVEEGIDYFKDVLKKIK